MEKVNKQANISVSSALKLVGIIAGVWAILVVITSTISYHSGHTDFSIFTTYLSDIGTTSGWPQILFNSGTLIAAPIRFLVIVLIILRISQFGAGRAFMIITLVIGFISIAGTVIMTAVPFNVSLTIHKIGIPLYFLGVVILQTLIGVREWSIKNIPKILPWLCFLLVIVYFVFALLVMLHERGMVGRNTPVIWEWLVFFLSIVWVFAQSILLGKVESVEKLLTKQRQSSRSFQALADFLCKPNRYYVTHHSGYASGHQFLV